MQSLIQGSTLQGGKYIIKKVLGQGGFGITYLAEHDLLRKQVAIKEFFMKDYCYRKESTSHVSVGTEGSEDLVNRFRQKFLSEARKIAHFQHANIIRISDVFEENGTAYYVMDYCEGGSLADLLRSYPKGIGESLALKYIRQIASALKCIHDQRMNHLDVKPANIMLDAQDNAILIDFGISKNFGVIDPTTNVFPLGISTGYTPIEQYTGIAGFSPETDIYSLGATLFKLITGQTPPVPHIIDEKGLPKIIATENIVNAIKAAMQYRRVDRPKNIDEWTKMLVVSNMVQITIEDTQVGLWDEEENRKREREKEFQRLAELWKRKESLYENQGFFAEHENKIQEKKLSHNNNAYRRQSLRNKNWVIVSLIFVALCSLLVLFLQKRIVIWEDANTAENGYDGVCADTLSRVAEVIEDVMDSVSDSCCAVYDEDGITRKSDDYKSFIALGDEYIRSLPDEQLYNSISILSDAAERGLPSAQYRLGKCFEDGKGVHSDVKQAKYWYEKAARQGDKWAQDRLALMYYWGKKFREDGLDKNIQEAIKWLERAANQGYEHSQYFLARIYFDGVDVPRDRKKALEWFTKSANQGNNFSMDYLGFMYLDGDVGIPQDPKMAYKWFRLSAAQGSSAGQIGLARCYHQGLGVERNMQEAFRLFKEASEQGQEFGTYMMGEFYEHGWVVEKNLEKAESLYKEAAEQGSVEAALALKFLNKQ